MKNRNMSAWLLSAVFIIAAVTLITALRNPRGLPYSSESAAPDGTKAAYLLLSELGFKVERKTQKEYDGEGVVLALGPEYLGNTGNALLLEDDGRFTNDQIRDNAVEFVSLMWPYRDSPIVFEEYGRAQSPESAAKSEEMTLWSVTPLWLKVLFLNLLCAAFYIAFFYGQRFGAPHVSPEFSGRQPLESVHAMAGAMEKARVYQDCADFYYNYCARGGNQWDIHGKLKQRLGNLRTEREALVLIAEIDTRIKEYLNEGKGSIGYFDK